MKKYAIYWLTAIVGVLCMVAMWAAIHHDAATYSSCGAAKCPAGTVGVMASFGFHGICICATPATFP